ncbi:odorant receptor 94a [Aedes aegypti]|uniref:Odorant receptor n=1 Tax=Aedes aegypti TaxID=7159 RepID=A0A6I8TYE6_AEDAE|nr:odorant receptor 94a [Aedes aegypti]
MASQGELISSVRVILWIYRIIGLSRENNQSVRYRIYRWVLNIPFLFAYLFAMIISALHEENSEILWKDTIFIILTEASMFVKVVTTYCRFQDTFQLLQTSVSEEFSPRCPCEQERHRRVLRHLNGALMGYLTVSVITACSTAIHIFEGMHKLPTFSWFFGVPYGPDHGFNYLLIASYQVSGMVMHCALNVSGDIQITYLLAIAGIQLDFLKRRFEDLKEDYLVHLQRRNLIHHNRHMQLVEQFVQDIERVYSPATFTQFCVSAITICATAFRISSNAGVAIGMMMYLLSMTVEIYLPCYYGNEITRKSQRLTNALYSCEWYRFDSETRRTVKMLMIRTNKPMMLKAGRFFQYSLDTFGTTLNSAYSLFAVLQNTLVDSGKQGQP